MAQYQNRIFYLMLFLVSNNLNINCQIMNSELVLCEVKKKTPSRIWTNYYIIVNDLVFFNEAVNGRIFGGYINTLKKEDTLLRNEHYKNFRMSNNLLLKEKVKKLKLNFINLDSSYKYRVCSFRAQYVLYENKIIIPQFFNFLYGIPNKCIHIYNIDYSTLKQSEIPINIMSKIKTYLISKDTTKNSTFKTQDSCTNSPSLK